jgi:hypothetical protein
MTGRFRDRYARADKRVSRRICDINRTLSGWWAHARIRGGFSRAERQTLRVEQGRRAPLSPSREGLSAIGAAGHYEEHVREAIDGFESVGMILGEIGGYHATLCAAHHRARKV